MHGHIEHIRHSLDVLFHPGDTLELRCVGHRPVNGYYRDQEKLQQDAHTLNNNFNPQHNVYVCLNPLRPDLYARRANQFGYAGKGEGVKDCDITCRRWLLIDIDPVRPAGVSATDNQKQAAVELAKTVFGWLQEQLGSTCIVCADSGNGSHMLIRLPDLPADDESRWVCERFLQMLSDRFSTKEAKVDQTTFNAARICTLYGTVKRKGSNISEQPHRLSRIVHVPNPLQPVDWQRMSSLVDPYPGEQQVMTPQPNGQVWDVEALLRQHAVEYSRDDNYRTASGEVATRYELEVCPFDPAHDDRAAVILQWPRGAVCFKCHHDGCAGKGWKELKQLWQMPDGSGLTAKDIILPSGSLHEQPTALAITRANTIQPQAVDWLWNGRIALGKLTIVAGYGGTGKTFLLCDLAARISAGLKAPDGQELRNGRVLIATGEDGLADTLVPRLITHGADLEQVDFVEGVRAGGELHLLDLLQHIDHLRAALVERPDTVMLLVDPISSFMGQGVDTHKTSDVRRVLSAVARMAEAHAIAFVGIHHLRKSAGPAIHAITGSQAFSDAVRTVWLVGTDRDDAKRRLMLPAKNNLAETQGSGLAYSIEMGRVIWDQAPVLLGADDLLQHDDDATPREEAKSWLQQRLEDGQPQPANELLKAAAADGIFNKTLRRAKKDLGVISQQIERAWVWQLPNDTSDGQVARE